MAQQAASSIGEAVSLSQALPAGVAQALMAAAKTALFRLIAWCWRRRVYCFCAGRRDLAQPRHRGETAVGAIAAATDPSPRAVAGESLLFNAAALTVAAGTPDIQGGHHLTVTRQHGYRQRAQAYLDLPVGEGG